MSGSITPYCTDEDLAIQASGDYPLLVPRDQRLAEGTDGAFDAADRWTLTSASVPFEATGLAPGQVVAIPRVPGFGGADLLVVASVSGGSATLRRKGFEAGLGNPPGPVGGSAGVPFHVPSLGPQIRDASYSLARRYGVDEARAGRQSGDLHDIRVLREACVLTVLAGQYAAQARHAGELLDDFMAKSRYLKGELDGLLGRLDVRWLEDGRPETLVFPVTRLTR